MGEKQGKTRIVIDFETIHSQQLRFGTKVIENFGTNDCEVGIDNIVL